MKKNIVGIAVVLVMTFCMCGCGGPDIEGSWYLAHDGYTTELLFRDNGECYNDGECGTYEIEKDSVIITYYNGDGSVDYNEILHFDEDISGKLVSEEGSYYREKTEAEKAFEEEKAMLKEENVKNIKKAFSGSWIYDSKWNEYDSYVIHNTLKLNDDGTLTFNYSVKDQNISGQVNGRWSVKEQTYDYDGCFEIDIDVEKLTDTDFYGTDNLRTAVNLENYCDGDYIVSLEALQMDIESGELFIEMYGDEVYKKEIDD